MAAEAVPAGKYSREALQNLAGAPGFPRNTTAAFWPTWCRRRRT